MNVEDRPRCMFSVYVDGSAGVVAFVRALHRGEGENSILDDGAAADTVAWTSWEFRRCKFIALLQSWYKNTKYV